LFFLSTFFFFICIISRSQTKYYISNSTGNDANPGTSPAVPWKSVNKVNAMWNVFVTGDSVLFNKGDIFYGSLTISGRNGTAINPIVFGSYGSGNLPVIRSSQPVTGWTVYSGNIWKATLVKLSKQVWNGSAFVPYYFRTPSLFINNIGQRLGREPDYNTTDGGFRTIASHLADNSRITEAANLPYTANQFQGAEVTIRTNREYFKTEKVTSHNGTGSPGKNVFVTATNTDPFVNTIIDQYGYFFQNHINTLNLDGEWCHDTTTSTLYLYSTTDPNTRAIEAPYYPSALVINNSSYLKVTGLQLENASDNTVAGASDDNVTIANCYINNSNLYGSYIYLITNSSYLNNTIINCNNSGLRLELCSGMTVSGNTIKKVGMYEGMGDQGTVAYIGLRVITNSSGNNTIIEKNSVDSIGYLGVNMGGFGVFVRQNEVSNFCLLKDDGGGIYCATNTYVTKIYQNFVHDAPGAPFGAPSGSQLKPAGIYSDNGSQNQEVYNNTIYNIGYWGILANLSNNNSYHDNTIFNCSGNALCLNTYFNSSGYAALSNNVKRNILFPRSSAQRCAVYINTLNPADLTSNLGTLDSNYYCQPYTGGNVVQVQGGSTTNYTLSSFKTAYPAYESHGIITPHLLNAGDNPATFLRLIVNTTSSVSPVNLGSSTYVDAAGTSYTGTVNIPAYGSLALIATSLTLPVTILEFNVRPSDNSALLSWKTENEQGNNYFSIERSENGIDFRSIGRVNGNGTTTTSSNYGFADRSPSDGINYYRLKQFDINGKFSYSPVRSVRFSKKSLFVITKWVQNNLFFLIQSDRELNYIITNMAGQQIYSGKTLGTKNIDISTWSPGSYFIRTESGDIERFIKD
jgi:hypothetical protein